MIAILLLDVRIRVLEIFMKRGNQRYLFWYQKNFKPCISFFIISAFYDLLENCVTYSDLFLHQTELVFQHRIPSKLLCSRLY